MIKLCFVCTGNTCRSVIAECLTKKYLKEDGLDDVKISSKGLFAKGEPVSENTIKVLKTYKINLRSRKSVKLKKVDKDTIYVAMTGKHKDLIDSKKVICFSSLIGEDIPDPYGQDEKVYEKVAKMIELGVTKLINLIKKWREM